MNNLSKMKKKSENVKRAIGSGTEVRIGDEKKTLMDTLIEFVDGKLLVDFGDLKKKIGTNVKSYLNADETRSFQWLLLTVLYGSNYRDALIKYGNITKEEHKDLKMGLTHLKKYCDSVFNRLDANQVDNIVKRTDGAGIRIFDQPTLKKLLVATEDTMSFVVLDREKFESLTEITMHQLCRNCTLDYKACNVFSVLSDGYTPESGFNLPNCPYAYTQGTSPENVDKVVNILSDIRKERMGYMKDPKMTRLADLMSSEISALDYAMEAVIASKGEVHDVHLKLYLEEFLKRKDLSEDDKDKVKKIIENHAKNHTKI